MRYDEDYLNDQFDKLLAKIDSHYAKLTNQIEFADDPIIDNARFIELMGISAKTAQSWRDKGVVSYSKIGSKLIYRVSDIRKMLDTYHVKSTIDK
jgi:hypothetical protein